MFSKITTVALALASVAYTMPLTTRDQVLSVTPHDVYSSSVGVLGCKINTNRVAYFPGFPRCDSVCVRVWNEKADLYLLHIDSSGGAYDISYDAWNMLNTGMSATAGPTQGGGIPVNFQNVGMDKCMDLIHTDDKTLPLMAANSMGYYAGCQGQWVGEHSSLWNIATAGCTLGIDEQCRMPPATEGNQAICPSGKLGATTPLAGIEVMNIAYGTKEAVKAVQ